MMSARNLKYILPTLALLIWGCVEEIPLETETFENILVVEAIISDDVIRQEIKLTRAFTLEGGRPEIERNANIIVLGDDGSSFSFVEVGDGSYRSQRPFAAQPGVSYVLDIVTQGGEHYTSEQEQIIASSEIQGVNTIRTQNNEGETGVLVTVDGSSSAENAFYLYRYAETYKIISPYEADSDLTYIRINDTTYTFEVVPKTKEEKTCYNTLLGNSILVASTENLQEKQVKDFPVRFLNQSNPYIANRYSILVSQYVVSNAAFRFYSTLKELSESSNVFAQNQPGFLEGNLTNVDDSDTKVIGFFSVASVAEKRVFFNYEDFFPTAEDEDEKGDLARNCVVSRPGEVRLGGLLEDRFVKFLAVAPPDPHPVEGGGPYRVVPINCMDCTVFGTNVKPDFWEE